MNGLLKRFLSLAMAFVMVLSCVPTTAFATEVCEHAAVQTDSTATCAEAGVKTTTCLTCGVTISTEDEAATGLHNYVAGEAVAPTCTEEGYTPYTCSLCKDTYQGDKVAATGHNFVEGICVCGETDEVEEEPEEDEQVKTVQAMIDALPSEVYQSQLEELQPKFDAAAAAYGALTEEQRAQLVNAEKIWPSEIINDTSVVFDNKIETVEDLQEFATLVNEGNSFAGQTFTLENDLDLNYTAVIIGTEDHPFKGIFDGGNHTISNLTIYENGSESDYLTSSDKFIGLFGYSTGTIKNVTVHNPFIVGEAYVGGIVGCAYTGKVENCRVTGEIDIEGNYMVGGITGHGYAEIKDCSVIGEEGWGYNYIGATYVKSNLEGDNVGGIVGHHAENMKLSGCTVKNVTVEGTRKIGGIVGTTFQSNEITGCTVENVVVGTNATEEYAADNAGSMAMGGIIGMTADKYTGGKISDCSVENVKFTNKHEVTVSTGAITGGHRGTKETGPIAPTGTTIENVTTSDVEGATNTFGMSKVELPEVVITDIKNTLTANDPDLTFALNFAVKDMDKLTEGYLNALFETYGHYYTDYVLTISGLSQDSVTFNENGKADGYLAGQYDAWSENWATVPFQDATIKNGESLYIMQCAAGMMGQDGLRVTLQEIAAIVQNFDCGIYFTPEFLAANPDMKVTLELKVFTEDAEGNIAEDISVATNNFDIADYAAIVSGEGKKDTFYTNFTDALNAAEKGDTITLLTPYVVEAGETVTLDLKGATIVYNSTTQGEAMITNKGTLTINDTVGGGVINYNYTGAADPSYGKGNYTISNSGTLTVNGGKITIANLSKHAKYPIDNNSTTGNAVLVINGGHLYNYNTSAIRQFCNSTTYKNSVTIKGGVIEGYCAIWVQNPGNSTVNGTLTINGGELKSTASAYVNGTAALKDVSSAIYYTISGEGGAWTEDSAVTITGGTFNENVYLAENAPAVTIGENVTFNGYLEVPNPAEGKAAQIGDVYYDTFEAAYEAAQAGDTITLLADVKLSQILVIDKAITLDGNDNELTSTAARAINIETTDKVEIKNLIINAGERAINIINKAATVELNNVTATANNNAVMIATTAGAVNLTINNSNLTGLAVVNVAGASSQVAINDTEITNVDASASEIYGAITVWTSAENANVAVTRSKIVVADDSKPAYVFPATATVTGVENVGYIIATIGDAGFDTLAEAIDAAKDGNTITLIRDAVTSDSVVIQKDITIDLNGKTISGTCNANQASLICIENNAGLTVKDGVGGGKITYAAGTSNVGWTVDVKGNLVLESGTIELTGSWSIGYAVDVRPNSWGTEYTEATAFVMNGGNIVSSDGGVRVASSSAAEHKNVAASFTMNGGKIDAAWDGVFIQQSNAAYDVLSFTMNGGTIESDLNPVRVYGPAPTSYVNSENCMAINLLGGTMTYTGTEARTWVIDGILRVGGGSSADTIIDNGALVVSAEVAKNVAPDGYKWVASGNNYTLAHANYVAQVGGTQYESLQEAIYAADGATVTLLADITLTETVTVPAGKTVILNLNGKTIAAAYEAGSTTNHIYVINNKGELTITGNGEINTRGIYNYGTMTLESGIINAIDGNGGYGVRNYEGATFNMNGGTIATTLEDDHKVDEGGYDATTVRVDKGATFVMNAGIIENICDYTFAIDNYGTATINNGTVTSVHSTVSSYGTLTINGGKFTCNGLEGVTAHALVVWDGSKTTINGGTFDGKDNYNGFNVDAVKGATVEIKGGTFLSVHSGSLYGEGTIAVSGGIFFDKVPEEYCKDGYIPTENADGTYGVKQGSYVAQVGEEKFESLAEALTAAENGDTITLLKDAKLTGKIEITKSVTINGNGHSIIADETAVWYTVSGKLNIKNYKTHLIGVNSDNVTLKNIVLDCNNNAAGINIYCAQNVVFDNVSIINATKGMAALTVNGSTLTAKNAFTALGNSVALDISNGSGVTSALGMTVEEGTVFDLGNKTVKFASVAVLDMTEAVDAEGKAYFAAMDNAYLYTQAQIDSRTTGYTNGLTLLADVNLTKDITVKGTLNLNGHNLTVAEGKAIKTGGNLTVTGEGAVEGSYVLTSVTATLTGPADLKVTTTVADYVVVYENGVHKVEKAKTYVAQIGETKYESLQEAFTAGGEVKLLTDITLTEGVTVAAGKTVTLDLAGNTVSTKITEKLTKSYALITNKGTLTVTDSSENKTGKLSVEYTGETFGYGMGLYTISNEGGTLDIKAGTVENLTTVSGSMYDAIDNNSTLGNTVLNVSGGTINCAYLGIRQFANSTTYVNTVNITGGSVTGGNSAIWTQNPGSAQPKANIEISNGAINGRILLGESDAFGVAVSGGTFDAAVKEAYCAEGYIPTANDDGTYGVKKGSYVARVNGVGYETITAAINAANNGDTVNLLAGTFDEVIAPWSKDSQHTSEKSITIVGAEDFGTVLTGGMYLGYDDNGCREHTITIKGIAFESKGILVAGQKNVVIDGNKFTNITDYVAGSSSASQNAISVIGKNVNATVTNNVIDTTASGGIHLRDVENATVTGNSVANVQDNTITINPTTGSAGAIVVENNTLSNWGLGGEGRAMRISGGATVNVNGNVMTKENAPEEFVKVTGTQSVDASMNYWGGETPMAADMFATDLAVDPAEILVNYYSDAQKTDLVTIAKSVAKIDSTYYATLQAAIDAAEAGAIVTVLNDIVVTETVKIAADDQITLDLNGKIIDGTKKVKIALMSYGDLTVKDSSEAKTGVIKAGIGTAGNAVNICGGTFTMESGSIYSLNNAILIDEEAATINIEGGKITAEPATKNSAAMYVSSTSDTVINITAGDLTGYNGILLWNNTAITMTGGSIDAKGSTGIQGNGSKDNTKIDISGDASVSGYYAAIYHPQGGELNISGKATLTGWTGVVVKGGTVTISGGTISGTGAADTYKPVSSGYVDTGDGLYVEHYDNSTNSENYGTPTVTVTGGTFTSVNGKSVASYANTNNGVEAPSKFISGGTFSDDVSALCADGYKAQDNGDGTYGIVEKPAEDIHITINMDNMELGNSLALIFWIRQDEMREDVDYTAKLIRSFADGTTETVEVPENEWKLTTSNGVKYYKVKYDNFAAKEMTDEVSIQIFMSDGTAASNVFTDSIREYAMFTIGYYTSAAYAKFRTAMVDMLNYGSAAQKQFSYKIDDLANSQLTAEQQKMATQSVALEDHWTNPNGFGYGSNLELISNIVLHIWVKNVTEDMYAEISFTNHYNELVTDTVYYSEFTNRGKNIYSIPVDELVVADGNQVVTCKLFNGNGELVGTVTESVNSCIKYTAESMSDVYGLYDATAKFVASAYNYFHEN